ncbi:MAG: TolC family protein [Chitinophagaceae bacterium]|nr:MAG: TolC family protein [Chitinophagaceae bacterium]
MKNYTRRIFFCFLLFIISPVNQIFAAESLSLDLAIQQALERNFDIIISDMEVDIAENNNRLGNAGFYPDLDLLINQRNQFVNADNPASFLNGEYRNIGAIAGAELNWTIFNGFRAHISKSRLSLLEEQSRGFLTVVVENTIQGVIMSYFQSWIEKEKMNVLESLTELSKDRLEYVEYQRSVGSASSFDVLQLNNNFIQDSTNLARQKIIYNRSLRNLKRLIRADEEIDLELTDEPSVRDEGFERDPLYAMLLSNNSNIRNQFVQLEIYKKNTSLQRTNRYPRLSMNTGTSYNLNEFKLEDNPSTTGRTFEYYINFGLSFNLFSGGNISREIQNAKINELIAETSYQEIEESVKFEFFNAFDNYEMLNEVTGLLELNKNNTERLLSLAEDRFNEGSINIFEYRTIQLDYLNAVVQYYETMLDLKSAEVELLRLTGGIIDEN